LSQVIEQVTVFARVTPEHKLKIVKAFQSKGHIVAMTGDGVNDAPAIKASDIGISMGMTGTDVTKEASSLILMDDNFNTIKEAIKEGRNIYENIRKFIRYLLTSNVGEIFVMLAAMLMSLPLPLIPVQILWVNLVTDGFPALALGLDTPKENAMKEKPRSPKEGIFARGLGFKILSRGLLIGIVSLAAFMISYDGQSANLEYARTITFTTLVLAQLIHVFDCRADGGIFSRNPFSNLYLIGAVLSSLILLIVVIYAEGLQLIFETTALSVTDWLFTIVLSIIPTILFGFSKKKYNNVKYISAVTNSLYDRNSRKFLCFVCLILLEKCSIKLYNICIGVVNMVYSMTGYGNYTISYESTVVTIEIKRVNSRYLDVISKIPRSLQAFEHNLKKLLQHFFNRGRIELYITIDDDLLVDKKVNVNWNLLDEYMLSFEEIKEKYNIHENISLSTLLQQESLFVIQEERSTDNSFYDMLYDSVEKACEQVIST